MQRRSLLLAGTGLLTGSLLIACGGGDDDTIASDSRLPVRRNVTSLNTQERESFVKALHAMKAMPSSYRSGINAYDYFVAIHVDAFANHHSNAHMSTGFLPWHREMLKRFEKEMQKASGDARITLPYWDWHQAGAHRQIFTDDFLGGNGDAQDEYLVKTGAFRAGEWSLDPKTFDPTPDEFLDSDGDGSLIGETEFAGPLTLRGLTRRFVYQGKVQSNLDALDTLMASRPLDELFKRKTYDAPPYMEHMSGLSPSEALNLFDEWTDVSFRKFLEARWHNPVHAMIGGQMGAASSPNDPAFFLHHCNVDRIWALWQEKFGNTGYPSSAENAATGMDTQLDILSDHGVVLIKETFDLKTHSGVSYQA